MTGEKSFAWGVVIASDGKKPGVTTSAWPDRRLLDLFGIELPIIQAPMAGASGVEMVLAVAAAGALGSLPCAMLSVEEAEQALITLRRATAAPLNLNFVCHAAPSVDLAVAAAWRERLAPYYLERGIEPPSAAPSAARAAFDDTYCALVERHRPEVVSFHFGLPEVALLERVAASGAKVIASATTVAEAVWLEAHGCAAVIAMGFEAGGHRGNFLTDDMARQVGTFALVPQVVDAVKVPVIAAGGIADGRGIAAAFVLGAAGVQVGTAYLFCPEARISDAHRAALSSARDDSTLLTNVFTGRPARGLANRLMLEVGPLSSLAPAYPLASSAIAPLRQAPDGARDFSSLWSGQGAPLGRTSDAKGAKALTEALAHDALTRLRSLEPR